MSNKMLIDAGHPEETRVVVLRGNRVEEFDFEAADRQQLRGNIYLAKVTRVEPSLQAAFVDYGGNRHGFLAFSEIHPDYYQIPYADRQALIQEQAQEEAEFARADEAELAQADERRAEAAARREPEAVESAPEPDEAPADAAGGPEAAAEAGPSAAPEEAEEGAAAAAGGENSEAEHEEDEAIESVGAEDALEELPERRKPRPRQYKIQEVIKRRQVMLVQVVKEERGSKGAALTTYLSLAGRYSVLMPNTARGGGISRKITTPTDRKRLKEIAGELEVPEGMGVILRTAGANRTKSEIKRDFEYLLRLWENVRELTLRSTAPKLVYEEGSLIKRAIRDLYSREIDQVIVAGEPAYREAKDFMRMLMPSHARNVQLYRDDTPIFARSSVEAQLDAMFSPQVTLKSGGYIVINQTEALVSIDVNSGRSTREHSIEDTALSTNLEAAEEISRQLRLRDLAGLIVIDFIDMEEKRNNRSVERKLKDCLKADRARIQVGRISHFGLLEMSRQRIRTGVLESSTVPCPHCRGTGQVRSVSSLSLQILRSLEDHLLRHSGHHLIVRTRPDVALYVLNQKRRHLDQLEQRFGLTITVDSEAPENGAGFAIDRGQPVLDRPEAAAGAVVMAEAPVEEQEDEGESDRAAETAEGRDRRRRRRRRRGNGEDRPERQQAGADRSEPEAEAEEAPESEEEPAAAEAANDASDGDGSRESRRRRRGRRGGKRRTRGPEAGDQAATAGAADEEAAESAEERFAGGAAEPEEALDTGPAEGNGSDAEVSGAEPEAVASDLTAGDRHSEEVEALVASAEGAAESPEAADLFPDAAERREPEPEPVPAAREADAPPEMTPMPEDDHRPKRSGWWSRKSSFF